LPTIAQFELAGVTLNAAKLMPSWATFAIKLTQAMPIGAAVLVSGCTGLTTPTFTRQPHHSTVSSTAAPNTCQKNPLGQRKLYLRGSFNQWNSPQAQVFGWTCREFVLITQLKGHHSFKVGDEAWSADADWGRDQSQAEDLADGQTRSLRAKGKPFFHAFNGTYRFAFTANATLSTHPKLTMTPCTQPEAPLGKTQLFLRGSMNNWGALDNFAFEYSCDAYYLNVKLQGLQQFKIASVQWDDATTFGALGRDTPAHNQAMELHSKQTANTLKQAIADIQFQFDGDMTVRLAFEAGEPRITVGPQSFAATSKTSVTDPLALSATHHSRSAQFKQPFGAQVVGTPILFAMSAKPGITSVQLKIEKRRLEGNQEILEYSPIASLPMTLVQSDQASVWQANYVFDAAAVYGYWFDIEIQGKHYAYQNNTDIVYWTREKGSNGAGQIEEFPDSEERFRAIRRFRHTTYEANFSVPDWAANAVYYYIFPERFRNGNSANDPKPGVTKYQKNTIEFHTNWLDKPYKPGTGDGSDTLYNNDFYGGDLQGIIEKLDYIADLGANVIYMTPLFKAASNHKYDTADYTQIDPHFGSNEDFVRLSKEAKARGIRVIVDASFNHVGADSKYFNRFGNYDSAGAFSNEKINPNSPYADWFSFDKSKPTPDTQYRGWVGVSDLPELNKNSASYRAYVLTNPDSITKRWLTAGASGWRMDVTPWVPDDFWRQWRQVVKATDPNAMTIAETWWDSSKYFLGDTFDSTMNYIFRNTVIDYVNGGDAASLYANLELTREAYPAPVFHALFNLLGSHDQARPLHLFGATERSEFAALVLAKAKLKLAVQFQMWFPGSPAIYYGDEVGVLGGEDPYNRATYPWADKGGKPDLDLHSEFKKLTALRRQHPILSQGKLHAPLFLDKNVIVLLRQLGNQWAITATNNSDREQTVTVNIPALLRDKAFEEIQGFGNIKSDHSTIKLVLPALGGRAYVQQ
jgi:cyclomaltodextrinase / maltogenic alpha-amylase / neopullulanase